MAQKIVETDEPVVKDRQTVVHEDRSGSNLGAILLAVFVIILLILLFVWRPWGGSSGGSNTNVNVPAPSSNTGH